VSIKLEVNERIRATQVRLIDETGAQKGIRSLREAINYAQSRDLDLVKIADATPPVCKVLDAGKYLYEQQKQQKAHAKKQRAAQVETKEVQLRPVTDTNDMKIKARKAREFLADGNKVRVVMRFRGREAAHKQIGTTLMESFMAEVGDSKIEQALKDSGRELSLILAPAPAPKPAPVVE